MIEQHYEGTQAVAMLSGLTEAVQDWRRPMASFRAYMVREVQTQILVAGQGATGGTARGVTWSSYAPQYRRRDGTVVEAWGDVPKVRGTGNVKGKKGGSGRRITRGSRFFEHVKAGSLLSVHHRDDNSITIGPTSGFAAKQNSLRQFAFYTNKDVEKLERTAIAYAKASARAKMRSAQ